MFKLPKFSLPIGCFIVVIFAIILPKIIILIDALANLIVYTSPLIIFVLLYFYEERTGNLSYYFRRNSSSANRYKEPVNNIVPMLPSPKEELQKEILLLNEKIDVVIEENQNIKSNAVSKLEEVKKDIDTKNKTKILNNIFGNTSMAYSKSDIFEQERRAKKEAEREENLSNREFQQTMKEQLYEVRVEAKEERFAIRSEMKDGFMYLEKQYLSLKEFVFEKFHFLNAKIETSIADVKGIIADFKTQVGREIFRLDSNMLGVVEKLENYNTRVERYSYEVKKAVLESEKHGLRAERLLQQSQTLYAHHKAEVKVLSKDIDVAVQKMVLKNGDFANKVSGAKLMLDRQTMEMTDSLKQIAHEKMGARLLQDANAKNFQVSEMKLNKLVSENRHIEQRMQVAANNERQMSQLRHQLNMNQENLNYTKNQNSALRQEAALIKRFSK